MRTVFVVIFAISLLFISTISYSGQYCDELYIRFDITDGGYNPVLILKYNGRISEKVIRNIVISDVKSSELTFQRNRSKQHQIIMSIKVNHIVIAHVIENIGDNKKILIE